MYHYAEGDELPTEGCDETVQDKGISIKVWGDPNNDDFTDDFTVYPGRQEK